MSEEEIMFKLELYLVDLTRNFSGYGLQNPFF